MGKWVLDFHPTAAKELVHAVEWYLYRSPAAADAFILAFDGAIDRIAVDPGRAAVYMHGHRAVRIGEFPYLIIYKERGSRVRISAVAHTSRRPGYWKNRRFPST